MQQTVLYHGIGTLKMEFLFIVRQSCTLIVNCIASRSQLLRSVVLVTVMSVNWGSGVVVEMATAEAGSSRYCQTVSGREGLPYTTTKQTENMRLL